MKAGNHIDFAQYEARNLVLQNLASAPSSPKYGQAYYNTSTNVGYVYNGTAWRPTDAAALTDGSVPIAALATNPLSRANHTGTQTASTISDLATTVKAYTLDAFAAPAAAVSMGSFKLTNLANGTANTDAVNLGQVNSIIAAAIAGQTAVKNPVRVATGGPITLSGTQTVDGVALAAGDRVLVTAQGSAVADGIYVVSAGSWAYATDVSTQGQLIEGTDVLVNEGSTYAGSIWRLTTTGTVTPGATNQVWVQTARINTYTADGTTLQTTGMQFSARLGYGLVTQSAGIAVDTSKVPSKFATTITGDNTTTSFPVVHNLGTTDVQVTLRDSTGAQVLTDNVAASTTSVTLSFGSPPPAATTYRVIVIG